MNFIAPSPAGATALVVENEYLIMVDIEDALRSLGFKAITAVRNLPEALAAIARETFDFAVLDVQLDSEQTFPAARELQARNVPFVFCTGFDHPLVGFESVPVVRKPFSWDDLGKAVTGSAIAAA